MIGDSSSGPFTVGSLMRFTGAIKNMFGVVPGFLLDFGLRMMVTTPQATEKCSA